MRSRAAAIVFVLYLIVLGLLVLSPTHPDEGVASYTLAIVEVASRHPLTAWITIETVNDVANFVIFLPFGLIPMLALHARRWWLVALVGCLVSFGAEGFQALFLPGRTVDLQDAISGSVGVIAGALLGFAIARGRRGSRKRS